MVRDGLQQAHGHGAREDGITDASKDHRVRGPRAARLLHPVQDHKEGERSSSRPWRGRQAPRRAAQRLRLIQTTRNHHRNW